MLYNIFDSVWACCTTSQPTLKAPDRFHYPFAKNFDDHLELFPAHATNSHENCVTDLSTIVFSNVSSFQGGLVQTIWLKPNIKTMV